MASQNTRPAQDRAPVVAPQNAVVWAEIPVADLARARRFYEAVLDTALSPEQMGPFETLVFPYADGAGVSGHLYEGRPAGDGRGPAVSLTVSDPLDTVMARVRAAGGAVQSEVMTIPFGAFFYATDPDGNALSFFRF